MFYEPENVSYNFPSLYRKIYTSMHQLREFFETEKEYVNDIRQMMEKKLVSQKAVASLGKIFSFRNLP
jgi:hypothetical protein